MSSKINSTVATPTNIANGLNIYAGTAMVCVIVLVALFSFAFIKNWTLKNEKFRRILYLSLIASLLLSGLWTIELVIVALGYGYSPLFWTLHDIRFWISSVSERLLICVYYTLFFILISRISLSQVKVSRLLWLSMFISTISAAEGIYLLVFYNAPIDENRYVIDNLNKAMDTDFFLLTWQGINLACQLLEFTFVCSSYFYVKHYLKSRPKLQESSVVISTVAMLRRLMPIIAGYLLPKTLPYLLTFISIWLPDSFYESNGFSLFRMICYYGQMSSIAFLPILIKWAIQPPPPSEPSPKLFHTHELRSRYDTSTLLPLQPEGVLLNRGGVVVQVDKNSVAIPATNGTSTLQTSNSAIPAALANVGESTPFQITIEVEESRIEDRGEGLEFFDDNRSVIARMERAVANFLGFAAHVPATEVVVADIMAQNALDAQAGPAPAATVGGGGGSFLPLFAPRASDALFGPYPSGGGGGRGGSDTGSEVDFGALEGIMGRAAADEGRAGNGNGNGGRGGGGGLFGFSFGFGFDPRLGGRGNEEGGMEGGREERQGEEERDLFEMNSMYNRDGKNLLPDGLL